MYYGVFFVPGERDLAKQEGSRLTGVLPSYAFFGLPKLTL